MEQNAQKEREKILEIKNLCMEFPAGKKKTVKALNNVTFDIYKGENFGLVGESGCGKTTLGRTLIRLYNPTSGEILFNGKNISGKLSKADRDYVTRNLSMIFQDPVSSLNPRMTVEEIIAEGLKTRGEKDKELIRKSVSSILNKVGLLPEHSSRYPHEFSGGQRQRIGIARSLVVKPSVIIADEPVSALDVSIQAQVINLLMDIKKEMDLTILFIAHNLAVVKYFSDRIGVMHFGTMVELADGRPDAALLTLAPLEPYIQNCARIIDGIHLNVLTAIALRRKKDERWRERLTAALDAATEYRFIRTVSVYGTAVLPLLEALNWDGDKAWSKRLMAAVRMQAAFYPHFLESRLAPGEELTPTELQILHLICADKSNAEIAQIMDVKLPTVKTHVSHILDKLDVKRRAEARTAAKKLRLIPDDL